MRFDSKARTYDQHAGPQRTFAAKTAEVILGIARRDAGVVELGAGTGALTRHLCGAGLCVLATDASPDMVVLGKTSEPRANWQMLDAFAEIPPSAALQVSSGLLQWAAEPLQVLQRWSSALTAGGKMVHAFPCRPCLHEWYSVVPRGPLTWHDREEWLGFFHKAGLRVDREQVWSSEVYYPTALDLVRSMHHSGVTGPRLLTAGELRRAIRQYEVQYRQTAGVAATWVWQCIEARLATSELSPLTGK